MRALTPDSVVNAYFTEDGAVAVSFLHSGRFCEGRWTDGEQVFSRDDGGFVRLVKMFDGRGPWAVEYGGGRGKADEGNYGLTDYGVAYRGYIETVARFFFGYCTFHWADGVAPESVIERRRGER